MLIDSHIHTKLCKHAGGEIADYVKTARDKGIPEICITDHAPSLDGYDLRHRMEPDKFEMYRQTVQDLRENSRTPTVLYGIEADYYDGCEKVVGPWLKQQDFDLVIGSIHYIRNWGFENPAERSIWDSVDVDATWREYFDLIRRLADSKMYDVVGHLDVCKKFGYMPDPETLKNIAMPVLDRIAAAGMAIELNTSGLRKTVKEIYPSPMILKMAYERKIPICFGSDAHQPDEVGYEFNKALALAKEAGYTEYVKFSKRRKIPTPLPSTGIG
jgi:histidinol-phosphatase (PHP family)